MIWKEIKNYEGKYQISNLGEVKSLNYHNTGKEKILKCTSNGKGYLQITLHKNNIPITFKIHRLVAEAFIPNPDNLPQVNHIDENKLNNCVDNLEWCDNDYNIHYGTGIARKSKQVLCVETGIIYSSRAEVEKSLNIANTNITACCKGKRKTAGGYHWEEVD